MTSVGSCWTGVRVIAHGRGRRFRNQDGTQSKSACGPPAWWKPALVAASVQAADLVETGLVEAATPSDLTARGLASASGKAHPGGFVVQLAGFVPSSFR
jgi:hypothetical protein